QRDPGDVHGERGRLDHGHRSGRSDDRDRRRDRSERHRHQQQDLQGRGLATGSWGPGRPGPHAPRTILDVVATTSAPVPALAWLPNGLTILRFMMIPAFIVVYADADNGHSWAAGIIFGVAGITDQVDGWLARRWHVESEFGKFADPLADRLMIDTAVVMLVI